MLIIGGLIFGEETVEEIHYELPLTVKLFTDKLTATVKENKIMAEIKGDRLRGGIVLDSKKGYVFNARLRGGIR